MARDISGRGSRRGGGAALGFAPIAALLLAGCGASAAATPTPAAATATPSGVATSVPTPTPAPTPTPTPVPLTTVVLNGMPTVTVSLPAGWTPKPVVGDGSLVSVGGPNGDIIEFTHPTAGAETATGCEQSAPSDVPSYKATASQPITIDGSATLEYTVPDQGAISYAASTYVGGGACWTAIARPGSAALDLSVVNLIFTSVKYGSF
jgi:hypothetical protein